MAWTPVQAGHDHLEHYARRRPVDALAELIWNALDAESSVVDVAIQTSSMFDDKTAEHVTRVVVSDRGHGIDHRTATTAFASLGDSWKKLLNGRTVNGLRVLHGRQGRGRFFAYALGYHVHWSSVYRTGDGGFAGIEIDGNAGRIQGFEIGDPSPSDGPPGTVVTIDVEQGRCLPGLLRPDLLHQLSARFAAHLLGNSDIIIRVNGEALDPHELVEAGPTDIVLADISSDELDGHEAPILTIIDWTDDMRQAAPLVLCNEGGASLLEVEGAQVPSPLKTSGYLKWSRFADADADLLLVEMDYPDVMAQARHQLAEHIRKRTSEATANIVAQLKAEGAYPYRGDPKGEIEDTERRMYDLVLVAARPILTSGAQSHRRMSAQLLKIALEERPGSLDTILAETLKLTREEQEELADMLRHSTLGAIVGAATEVARRLDLIAALRYAVYDSTAAPRMREVDQLHPLVRDNVWLFGEEWRLARSEIGLTTILREVLKGEGIALEQDLQRQDGEAVLPETLRGRVDLLLQRSIDDPRQRQRLVVELKRPSTVAAEEELRQVKRYARQLANHAGAGGLWTFWLVVSETAPEIEDELAQPGRQWGHALHSANYDIRVTTWGRLLDDAERRLNFYQQQLQYDIAQDEAVERVRARHGALLPPRTDPAA